MSILYKNGSLILLLLLLLSMSCGIIFSQNNSSITHFTSNSAYWQYENKPILLLGGSSEDNLFQSDNLENEIKVIKLCGGNYVRNTLSSRDSGNVWAFGKDSKSGLYNLNKWNSEYWKKLDHFFDITNKNDIIVQMELWATFDFYRDVWNDNPFNPKNNINYTTRRTKIDTLISTHPIYCENRFFSSVPFLDNNMRVLEYQQKFIDKVLSYSLKYNNILYCIDNETSVSSSWGKFWSEYIRKVAIENNKLIHITEMWDPHNLNHISHRESFDHPETYSFVEISQNNSQKGESHWINGIKQLERLSTPKLKRPINNVKVYGNDLGKWGYGTQNGKESFIRNIFFGSASSRFHRTNSGLGITKEAQNVIKSTRMLTDEMDFFNSLLGNDLLSSRIKNEAYCRFIEGKEYAVFFTKGGDLNISVPPNSYIIRWLDISRSEWLKVENISATKNIHLQAPSNDLWFVLITANDGN